MEEVEQIKDILEEFEPAMNEAGKQFFGEEEWKKFSSDSFNFETLKQQVSDSEKARVHLDVLKTASSEQYRNLASVSALCSTLLVIATFNDRIFPYGFEVKALLTILLCVIIVSIWGFYANFSGASEESFKELLILTERRQGKEDADKLRKIKEKGNKTPLSYVPFSVHFVVTLVILTIIYLIWR